MWVRANNSNAIEKNTQSRTKKNHMDAQRQGHTSTGYDLAWRQKAPGTHQALAPSSRMRLYPSLISVTDSLIFKASARAWLEQHRRSKAKYIQNHPKTPWPGAIWSKPSLSSLSPDVIAFQVDVSYRHICFQGLGYRLAATEDERRSRNDHERSRQISLIALRKLFKAI